MAAIETHHIGHHMERHGNHQLYSERFDTTGEAAVLFSAGFGSAAMHMLRRECEHLGAGAGPKAWAMLFEACHLLGERGEFDRLSAVYRARCDAAAAPRWGHAAPLELPGSVRLEGPIASLDDVRALVQAGQSRKAIVVDCARVERIDFRFSAPLAALLRSFGGQSKRVILVNIAELHAELLQCAGAGSHVAFMRGKVLEGGRACASNDAEALPALAAA
jgi:hypothetical protein